MRVSLILVAGVLVAGSAVPASAHCCHDDRMLGVAEESGLRRGTHSAGDRRLGEDDEENGPSVGRGLGGGSGGLGGNSTGGLQGNGLGNYGAGSLGERGPGGLGALRGDSIHQPAPRPR
jgi:hypothetical protein